MDSHTPKIAEPSGGPSQDKPAGASPAGFPVAFKLALVVGLTLSLLLAGLLVGSWFYWRDVFHQQVDAQLSAIAASRRELIHTQLDMFLQRMTVNTDRGEFRGYLYDLAGGKDDQTNKGWALATLRFIADQHPIISASLTDAEGKIVVSSDPKAVGQIVAPSSEFQTGMHEAHVGWPRAVNNHFEATLTAPIRLRAAPKKMVGTLYAIVDVSSLATALRDTTGLGTTGEALLVVRSGDQAHFIFPPRSAPETFAMPLSAVPSLVQVTNGLKSFFKITDYRGIPVLCAAEPINYRGWSLMVKMDAAEAYAPVNRAVRLMTVAGLLVIAAALGAAWLVALRFTRPVRQMADAAARVAAGDYTPRVPVKTRDEIGVLSASFNEMTTALEAHCHDRDAAEEALRTSERNFRQISESLPQLVWTCDAAGSCDYLSPQWVAYTGFPAESQLGTGWFAQIHPDDREEIRRRWGHITAEDRALDIEFRLRRHDDVYRWFRACATPLKDEQGRVMKWFGTNTDIDAARNAESALRDADRRKDEFLAMLGHELRNPLSAIANAAQLWKETEIDDPESAELARGIVQWQTAHLSRLVDDLLDIARITEGKIELRKRPVDAIAAVRRAVEALRPLLEERQHQLVLELSEVRPLRIDADPTRLEQIISNLLTNAAKYTQDGGLITVAVRRDGSDTLIVVSDNGIGIAPEMLPHIFDLFMQADHSLERAVGGLGLGLSLSRKLAELHRGTLTADSAGPGKGATFTIRLPSLEVIETSVKTSPVGPHSPAHCYRVLLVDDNIDTVRSLGRLLKRRGHEVATAYDGLTALKIAHEFRPDVLLLDLGLPGLDGYSLARRLRSEGFALAPMIAISGYAQEADRVRAHEAGFNRLFAKPVDFEALAALLAIDSSEMFAAQ